MKTFRQLHDLTDRQFGVTSFRQYDKIKAINGKKWNEIFDYLSWKYNTTKKQKEAEWDKNKKVLGL
jgi:glutathione peroxidase-family protein